MLLVSDTEGYEAAGAVCRRRVFSDGERFAVVFTSDRNARGKSITNQFEYLAQATAEELTLPASGVRWFEHRTAERTVDDYDQEACFQEVTFAGRLEDPDWVSADKAEFEREVGMAL